MKKGTDGQNLGKRKRNKMWFYVVKFLSLFQKWLTLSAWCYCTTKIKVIALLDFFGMCKNPSIRQSCKPPAPFSTSQQKLDVELPIDRTISGTFIPSSPLLFGKWWGTVRHKHLDAGLQGALHSSSQQAAPWRWISTDRSLCITRQTQADVPFPLLLQALVISEPLHCTLPCGYSQKAKPIYPRFVSSSRIFF